MNDCGPDAGPDAPPGTAFISAFYKDVPGAVKDSGWKEIFAENPLAHPVRLGVVDRCRSSSQRLGVARVGQRI